MIKNPLAVNDTKADLSSVLRALASQENCDGEPYDQMMEAADEIDQLTARVAELEEAVRRAPCHQNSIPCSWPCGNDPADHGPCWKQIALNNEDSKAARIRAEAGGDNA